jgi:hypothetical protein
MMHRNSNIKKLTNVWELPLHLNLLGRNQDKIYGQVKGTHHYREPIADGTKRCIDQNKYKTLRRNLVRRKRSEKGII